MYCPKCEELKKPFYGQMVDFNNLRWFLCDDGLLVLLPGGDKNYEIKRINKTITRNRSFW